MSILDLAHGMHHGVEEGVYHQRIPGLVSKSALDVVRRSPAHLRAWLDGADEEVTDALEFGRAFHCALLEPERFKKEFRVQPNFGDCRRRGPKAERDAWRATIGDAVIVSHYDHVSIQGMLASVRAHPLASKLLLDGESEVTLRWRDVDTSLECKGRADHFVPRLGVAVDVKTTQDARPWAFRKTVSTYRYTVQQAFYSDGFEAVGCPLRHFVFCAVEKTPPYLCALYTLDSDAVKRGRAAAHEDMIAIARCFETDSWPGYDTSIQTIDVPDWA